MEGKRQVGIDIRHQMGGHKVGRLQVDRQFKKYAQLLMTSMFSNLILIYIIIPSNLGEKKKFFLTYRCYVTYITIQLKAVCGKGILREKF